jgi:hypothetical protein
MHLKTAITPQKFKNATLYNLLSLLLLLLLLAERFNIRPKRSSVVSGHISFSGQFTPLETASSIHCNEDGFPYTVDLVTK